MNDDERDRAIVVLQDHYAKNRLEIEDFEKRVELAERARDPRALARALDGLPVIADVVEPADRTQRIAATFGSLVRRGRTSLPHRVEVKARFGSVELDLTEAELGRGETVIDIDVRFGSVSITVPDDLDVESTGSALFGSVEHMGQRARSKKDPRRVRITGRAVFGSVEIVVKRKPPPTLLDGLRDGVRGLLGR